LKAFYTRHFSLPLPKNHPFPIEKYNLLWRRVTQGGILKPSDVREPRPASVEELLRVHERSYVDRVLQGEMSDGEMRRIGFPWSPFLPKRSRRSCGGTIQTCKAALEDGVAANLAGGTHHAFPGHGEGYCVFNDCAVATRAVQFEKLARRIIIIDCDVHQGNGTAAIFGADATVFTFSIHGYHNYPFNKEVSDLDIALGDHTGDAAYLNALDAGLSHALGKFEADLALYLTGADPYTGDRNGRFNLTKRGLAERDMMVFNACRKQSVPVAVTMGGGYAREVTEIVDIHAQTVRIAAEYCR